ncbi:FAD-dependent oxidoreductase [Desulfosporosinus sp. BICA1-9]|uniref:oxidoreductase n=1 Tax=Desulfosporosinus sp. BICA1-9 TaxID=1531958 RepID=UPI00054C33C6|nr:FAD-dependent oxidoreductase [Desulfosporosinus sp. BICA1-9]KJS45952.1 MAG: NADH:flavin oxidoreductase [Peptococcaceae bacterium BRH_c23]KJS90540.1 MAG: NADH:flavin oxidoreductase [Desulfosporosinus sp. BICA1-9]HBW36807.1 FAD-binding protein [Desulfosporosinus sp.]
MSMLFSPAKIGTLQLRNRLVMTPMHLGYSPQGEVNDKLIEFYRARARGGVGLIVFGGCGIDRIGNGPGMTQLDDDYFIPGLRRLVEAVHAEGAKIVPQLYQAGRYAHSVLTGQPSVAPSPISSRLTRQTPEELTQEKINQVIDSFAKAAKRAQASGFDGVEILASAGYLISQFLSPVTNQRSDRYGGDLQARMTFGLEVVEAVRAAVGPDFPIIVRVAGNDFVPGSHTNTESRAFCQALEKKGVNALNVTGGWHETQVPQLTMNVPPGAYAYLAQGIKQAVSIPVFACNRINTPELAEEILQEGKADFIGMARPLLADPELPKKAMSGASDRIRPCIGCNQGCLDYVFQLKPVSCLVNAEAGREAELAELALKNPPAQNQQILVIGAGAAGLEFARVATLKGHKVTIWEESDKTGGQLALAAAPPGRQDFLYFGTYLANICQDLGVIIQYNVKATPEKILSAVQNGEFTRVVIATGARPITPLIKIEPGTQVLQAWDVLLGRQITGQNVIIVGGGAVGVDTALLLAESGTIDNQTLRFLLLQQAETDQEIYRLATQGSKKITVLEMGKGIGRDIGPSTRWSMLADLKRYRVNCLEDNKVLEIRADGVLVENAGEQRVIPADTVILAVGSCSQNELYTALQGKIESLSIIGDAAKPRKVLDAIHEAYAEGIK